MRIALFLALWGALLLPGRGAWALEEEPVISVKAEVNRAFITIGDPVEYTVTVKHSPSVQILSTVPPPSGEIFKIKKVEDLNRKEGKLELQGRKFTLTTFKLGEFILEPVEIKYRTKDGTENVMATERIFLTVKSVAQGEEKQDIRGLKGVAILAGFARTAGLLALAAAVLFAVLLFYRWLRKKQSQPSGPAAPLLTPEEEAIQELNRLYDSDLLRQDKIKDYYLRFSEILRGYLEKRFHILALEATTHEIGRELREKETNPGFRELVSETLEAADLAKFAKWKPEPAQIIQLNQKARQVVDLGKPAETAGAV